LAPYGKLVIVALPEHGVSYDIAPFGLILGNKTICGSVIGGIKETQEMLEFCAEKQTLPYVEMIPMNKVNEAYQRVINSDVMFRFVMDVKNTCPSIE